MLDLKYCKSLRQLPKGVVQLINLRHLQLPMMNYASWIHLPPGIGNLTALQTLTAFHVGKNGEEGCEIGELKDLMHLRGHLGISGLQNVYKGKDATSANLRETQHLQTLALIWNGDEDRGEQHFVDVKRFVAEGVLENLRPHSNLTQLIVRGYVGAKFPSWFGDHFLKLNCVTLLKCYNCEVLPPLGQLPFLQHLLVGYMHGVYRIGDEFYGSRTEEHGAFRALETLNIECMNEWVDWEEAEKDGDFTCLLKLVIKDCSKLKRFPSCLSSHLQSVELKNVTGIVSLPALPMLKSLTLEGNWTDEQWTSLDHLHSLETFEIWWSENQRILSLPVKLKQLKELDIQHCPELTSFVKLHALTSLESLQLYSLQKLNLSVDDQLPSMLRALTVTSCTSLTCIPLHNLSSLRELTVVNCPLLASLVSLQSLESLERLELTQCPELCFSLDDALPATLQSFEVSGCGNLKSLPLPHHKLSELNVVNCQQLEMIVGLHNLSSLKCLEISYCLVLSFSGDEPVHFTDVDVRVQECAKLVDWCREHGINYIHDDDLVDDFGDEYFNDEEGGQGNDDEDNWDELEIDGN